MKIFWLFFLLNVQSKAMEVTGVASSLKGNVTLYTEIHKITKDQKGLNKRIETKYLNPDGKIFAEMVSDFAKNPTVPEIKFSDSRFDRTEELIFDEANSEMIFKMTTGKKIQTKKFKWSKDMVVGQGFDNFIKFQFEQLKIASVPLSLGVIAEMDFFTFRGYKIQDVNKDVIQIGIELSSFFLRMFTTELVLDYDVKTQQILSYRGLSNILTNDAKSQDVLIKYSVKSEQDQVSQ